MPAYQSMPRCAHSGAVLEQNNMKSGSFLRLSCMKAVCAAGTALFHRARDFCSNGVRGCGPARGCTGQRSAAAAAPRSYIEATRASPQRYHDGTGREAGTETPTRRLAASWHLHLVAVCVV